MRRSKASNRKATTAPGLIIVHGRSEFDIFSQLKRTCRVSLLIMGKDHGHSSIQINKLQDLFFQSKDLNTPAGFKRKWPRADLEGTTKRPYFLNDFKIFVVMDTDDCNEETLRKFKDRSLFAGHWAYEWIVPVFNTENLEDVMERAGLPFTKRA